MAHAEQVAIAAAAQSGIALAGATMLLTWVPCASCARLLVLAGVRTLIADAPAYQARRDDPRYDFAAAMAILTEGGVTIRWHAGLAPAPASGNLLVGA